MPEGLRRIPEGLRRIARGEPALTLLLSLLALAAAWVSQHRFDMQPCPWCILQRMVFALLAVLAAVQWVLQSVRPAQAQVQGPTGPVTRLNTVLTAGRGLLALSGLAAAVWQHTVAASSLSCNLSWADRFIAATGLDGSWPELFQPRANCMEAKAWLLGVPYEFYSAALFILIAVLALAQRLDRTPG